MPGKFSSISWTAIRVCRSRVPGWRNGMCCASRVAWSRLTGRRVLGRALEHTRRALDASPECSLALAVEGFVHCHLLRDLGGAEERLNRALAINPSDFLAWLFSGVVQAFRGDGETALASVDKAIELSPLDPLRHYYDALACTAALAGTKAAARDSSLQAVLCASTPIIRRRCAP